MAAKIKVDKLEQKLEAASVVINDLVQENYELKRQLSIILETKGNEKRTSTSASNYN